MRSAAQVSKDTYRDSYAQLAPQLPGGPAARAMREAALVRFAETGFPSSRHDEWKYTRLTALEQRLFKPEAQAATTLSNDTIDGLVLGRISRHRLVFVNGYFAPDMSSTDTLPKGVTVVSLAQALEQGDAAVLDSLKRSAQGREDSLEALNAAFVSGGAHVHISRNTVVAEPIHLLFVASGPEGAASYVRNLIVAEEGSEASILETYAGLQETAYLSNAVTEIMVGRNAALTHYKLEHEGAKGLHLSTATVRQSADSRFYGHTFLFGGQLARSGLDVRMDGQGGECLLNGLFLGSGRQHRDARCSIDHAQPHCSSQAYYRGLVHDRARGVFDGRVVVRQDAQKSDARLASNNLLLSPHAEVDTKPQLEIHADDVKCSHGATVGQLSEDALFYLRSRGLDEEVARGLTTYAFACDILSRVPLVPLRTALQHLLISLLPQGGSLKELL